MRSEPMRKFNNWADKRFLARMDKWVATGWLAVPAFFIVLSMLPVVCLISIPGYIRDRK